MPGCERFNGMRQGVIQVNGDNASMTNWWHLENKKVWRFVRNPPCEKKNFFFDRWNWLEQIHFHCCSLKVRQDTLNFCCYICFYWSQLAIGSVGGFSSFGCAMIGMHLDIWGVHQSHMTRWYKQIQSKILDCWYPTTNWMQYRVPDTTLRRERIGW